MIPANASDVGRMNLNESHLVRRECFINLCPTRDYNKKKKTKKKFEIFGWKIGLISKELTNFIFHSNIFLKLQTFSWVDNRI